MRFADSVNSGWYWLGGSEEYRSGTYTYDGNTLTVSAGFYEITIDVASDGTSGVVSSSSWSDLILFQMIDGQYAEVEIIAYLSENY